MPYERLRYASADNAVLNEGTDEQLECIGYCRSRWKNALFTLWCFLNLGFPLLLIYWRPKWGITLRWSRCPLSMCTLVLLKDSHTQYFTVEVKTKIVLKYPAEYSYMMVSMRDVTNMHLTDRTQLNTIGNQGSGYKYFVHQHVKYVWDSMYMTFQRLRGYDTNTLCSDFYEKFKGFSEDNQAERTAIFGENTIDVEVKSYGRLLIDEVLNPFYIFQVFSIILWCSDDYYYYAGCIFTVTFISISVQLYKTRKQSETLHSMVTASSSNIVSVMRKDGVVEVLSVSLVPGDVLVIPPNGCTMVCDAVLVAGNCIVNESMLTGESVPETKTPLLFQEGEMYSAESHKRHTIFSGTRVIQTRYYGSSRVLAVVVRTGFNTAKGELVRSILYPKPIDFKFYRDSMKFIGILTCIATAGMIYACMLFAQRHYDFGFIIKRVLDIITIVVPPALPAAMTVGSVYAQNRLQKKEIYCISPPRINVCGKLKLFCFDKTGTLTEDGLDFWGVVPVFNSLFQMVVSNPPELPQKSPVLAAMASCHSLTMIEGALTGDPLDVKMFDATQWELEEVGVETTQYDRLIPTVVRPSLFSATCSQTSLLEVPYEIGIVRQFPFSSSLQMMSVVTRTLGKDHMDLYAKGAPEKIISLCDKASIPIDFDSLLHSYTVRGYRVIALAFRSLDTKLTWHQVQRVKRDQVEKNLTFLGFLIMQNTLKCETTPVICKLKDANIRCVMVTGDNLHTAISVARDCGMVPAQHSIIVWKAFSPDDNVSARLQFESIEGPLELNNLEYSNSVCLDIDVNSLNGFYHFATDGKSFAVIRQHFADLLPRLAIRGTIFARMAPEQKAQLVELLQQFGYIVGMCGDGANDCGALKAAHVGISLSETEASVAAPFTSKTQNIECVISVIREGRCALVTSFSVFKYMALYSIIQFVSVLILYSSRTNLGDVQFLYIDLAITTTMAIFMGYTGAYRKLVPRRPHGTLLSLPILASVFAQILLAAGIQIAAFLYLKSQIWFMPVDPLPDVKFTPCYETTVIFCVSSFQYMIVAIICAKGKPFRKPIYTNVPMILSILILTGASVVLLLHPGETLKEFLDLVHKEDADQFHFFLSILIFPAVNLVLAIILELFISSQTFKKIGRVITCKRQPKNQYKILEMEIQALKNWPRVGEVVYS